MSNYENLNEKQQEAVLHTEGPVLILAGAGSGKTRVITHRIAYLIDECGVNPWNILALTFTNKAAGEMRSRVDDMISFGSESIWVSTFHSTCVRILRRYIDRIGYDNSFTIYDTDDQKTIIKDVCKRLQIDTKQLKERSILAAISGAKDELISEMEFATNAMGDFRLRKIADAYTEYQKVLKKNNALDFDDLIVKTVELLKNDSEVLSYYQNRFTYIMVDEYQDTNTAQFELIKLLAAGNRNLCVVGDDDQSIYKFRGANIRNILDFEKVYPDALVVKLEQNYRSTRNILDAANGVIANNLSRKAKALWSDKERGAAIHFRQFDFAGEEAEYIADDIARKVRRGEIGYGDVAVLYRTNAQARMLEERMVRDNIPYKVVGGVNFYARKEIKDVLAYLKTIANGRDDVAVKRILNVPRRGIGATTLAKVQEFADIHGISFFDALCRQEEIVSLGKSGAKVVPFADMILSFRAGVEYYSIKDLVAKVLDDTGYLDMLRDSDEEDADDRIENVEELLSKVALYEESVEHPNLDEFLEQVALVADIDSLQEDAEYIVLMTLHSAKGLEFPHVYLAGMEDGLFPSFISIVSDDPTDIEEERRLAYVGITRAQNDLTITASKARMIRGETQYNAVSRFVKEIPKELMDGRVPGSSERSRDLFGDGKGEYVSRRQTSLSGFTKPVAKKPIPLQQIQGLSKGISVGGQIGEPDYGVGDRVSHVKFGEGTVLAMEKGPRDYQVTVAFDQSGQRKMYAAFAKLKKL